MADRHRINKSAPVHGIPATPSGHFRATARRARWFLIGLLTCIGLVGVAVAYAGATAARINTNVHRSDALVQLKTEQAVPKLTRDTNILVMGLDTRVLLTRQNRCPGRAESAWGQWTRPETRLMTVASTMAPRT